MPLHVRSLVLAGEISTLRGRHTDAVARLDAALACASAHADQFTDQPALIDEIVLDLAEAAVASEQPDRAAQVFHDARRRPCGTETRRASGCGHCTSDDIWWPWETATPDGSG